MVSFHPPTPPLTFSSNLSTYQFFRSYTFDLKLEDGIVVEETQSVNIPIDTNLNFPNGRRLRRTKRGSSRKFSRKSSSLECDLCERQFVSKKLYSLHRHFHRAQTVTSLFKADFEKEEFLCSFCEVNFASMDKLESHLDSHQETCKHCDDVYPNAFVMGIHMAEHDSGEQICCPFCDFKGDHVYNFKNHLFTKHFKLKILRCGTCGASYSSKSHLEEHVRFVHKKMDPHECIVCQRTFIFHSSLLKHQINLHRPYIDGDIPSNYCIKCKRTFISVESFQKHLTLIHQEEKPSKPQEKFICDICGKDYAYRQSWLLHTKGHSGQLPYQCKVCPKSFRVRAFLTQHEKIHSDERPFNCEMCGNCFKRKEGLRRHLQTHTDVKPFVCGNCGKSGVVALRSFCYLCFRESDPFTYHKCCDETETHHPTNQNKEPYVDSKTNHGELSPKFSNKCHAVEKCDVIDLTLDNDDDLNCACEQTSEESPLDLCQRPRVEVPTVSTTALDLRTMKRSVPLPTCKVVEFCRPELYSFVTKCDIKPPTEGLLENKNASLPKVDEEPHIKATFKSVPVTAHDVQDGDRQGHLELKSNFGIKNQSERRPDVDDLEKKAKPSTYSEESPLNSSKSLASRLQDMCKEKCQRKLPHGAEEVVKSSSIKNQTERHPDVHALEKKTNPVTYSEESPLNSSKSLASRLQDIKCKRKLALGAEEVVKSSVHSKKCSTELTAKEQNIKTVPLTDPENTPASSKGKFSKPEKSENVRECALKAPSSGDNQAEKGKALVSVTTGKIRESKNKNAIKEEPLPSSKPFTGLENPVVKKSLAEGITDEDINGNERVVKASQLLEYLPSKTSNSLKPTKSSKQVSDKPLKKSNKQPHQETDSHQSGKTPKPVKDQLQPAGIKVVENAESKSQPDVKQSAGKPTGVLGKIVPTRNSLDLGIEAPKMESIHKQSVRRKSIGEQGSPPAQALQKAEPKALHDKKHALSKARDGKCSTSVEERASSSHSSSRRPSLGEGLKKDEERAVDPKSLPSTSGMRKLLVGERRRSSLSQSLQKDEPKALHDKNGKCSTSCEERASTSHSSSRRPSLGEGLKNDEEKAVDPKSLPSTSGQHKPLKKRSRSLECSPSTSSSTEGAVSKRLPKEKKAAEDQNQKADEVYQSNKAGSSKTAGSQKPEDSKLKSGNNLRKIAMEKAAKAAMKRRRESEDGFGEEKTKNKKPKTQDSIAKTSQEEKKTILDIEIPSSAFHEYTSKIAKQRRITIEEYKQFVLPQRRSSQASDHHVAPSPNSDSFAANDYDELPPSDFQFQTGTDAKFSDAESSEDEPPPANCIYCEICGVPSFSSEALTQHIEIMHSGHAFKCFMCTTSCEKLDSLINHQQKHPGHLLVAAESQFLKSRKSMPSRVYPYYCNLCGDGFTLIKMIAAHKSGYQCRKKRRTDAGLYRETTDDAKELGKEVNGKQSVSTNDIDENKELEGKGAERIAGGMDKTEARGNENVRSMEPKTPSGPATFCEMCGFKFASPEVRQSHFHLQRFQCLICRRSLEDLSELTTHYELSHAKHQILDYERMDLELNKKLKYFCKFCGTGFYYIQDMLEHKALQHYVELLREEPESETVSMVKIFDKPDVIPGLEDSTDVSISDVSAESSFDNAMVGGSGSDATLDNTKMTCPRNIEVEVMEIDSPPASQVLSDLVDVEEYFEDFNSSNIGNRDKTSKADAVVSTGLIKNDNCTEAIPISDNTEAQVMKIAEAHSPPAKSRKLSSCVNWDQAADLLSKALSEEAILQDFNDSSERVQTKTFCEACGVGFDKVEDLRAHKHSSHSKYPFACLSCGSSYKKLSDLLRHQLGCRKRKKGGNVPDVTLDNKYFCRFCGEGFAFTMGWKEHMLVKHPKIDLGIDQSNSTKENPPPICSSLSPTETKPFSCQICPKKKFKKEDSLKQHELDSPVHQRLIKLKLEKEDSLKQHEVDSSAHPKIVKFKIQRKSSGKGQDREDQKPIEQISSQTLSKGNEQICEETGDGEELRLREVGLEIADPILADKSDGLEKRRRTRNCGNEELEGIYSREQVRVICPLDVEGIARSKSPSGFDIEPPPKKKTD